MTQVAPALNHLIANEHGETEIYNNMELDWSIQNSPQITQNLLEFGIKGLFFPRGKGEVQPPVTAPVMPYHDSAEPAKLQAYVSNYLLDSLASSYLETSGFHVWTPHTDVPAKFPFQLNTQDMDCFFPGLAKKYGVNKTIDVEYNLDSMTNF